MSNSNSSRGGVSCLGVFLIVFVVLKFTGGIDWSWWLVLTPLWISVILEIISSN